MSSYHVRPFEPSDREYAALAGLVSGVWPDYPVTARALRREDERHGADLLLRRLVAETGGTMVGDCSYGKSEDTPETFLFGLNVCTAVRGRGIGAALYDRMIEALSTQDIVGLGTETLESHDAALRFLYRRGFERVRLHKVSRLDVTRFEPAPLMAKPKGTADRGIEVKSLAVLREIDEDWQRKCWDLSWAIEQDIPANDRATRQTLEEFCEVFEDPDFSPEGWLIALDGKDWVGLHILCPNDAAPLKYDTDVTGVVRGCRRRGIATLLKLHGVEFVRSHGGRTIETDNEQNNPMLALNDKLGFVPVPAWIQLNKTF